MATFVLDGRRQACHTVATLYRGADEKAGVTILPFHSSVGKFLLCLTMSRLFDLLILRAV